MLELSSTNTLLKTRRSKTESKISSEYELYIQITAAEVVPLGFTSVAVGFVPVEFVAPGVFFSCTRYVVPSVALTILNVRPVVGLKALVVRLVNACPFAVFRARKVIFCFTGVALLFNGCLLAVLDGDWLFGATALVDWLVSTCFVANWPPTEDLGVDWLGRPNGVTGDDASFVGLRVGDWPVCGVRACDWLMRAAN